MTGNTDHSENLLSDDSSIPGLNKNYPFFYEDEKFFQRADQFYERVKDLPLRGLRKYLFLLEPGDNLFDKLNYTFNSERKVRLAAASRAFLEKLVEEYHP